MPIEHRPVPVLPDRPRESSLAPGLRRSYSVGRQEFSRACAGQVFEISVAADRALAPQVQVCLDTTVNARAAGEWVSVPFERLDDRTFRCRITPENPGLYQFVARASADGGNAWVRDAVPLAWLMVDPPQVDALRLYTMIPTVSGSIADWTADLPRIRAMGFNAIHLLPITRLDASQSPYSARDLFEIDDAYLAPGSAGDGLAQLEALVEHARELRIRLCFDLVLNHVGVRSTMARRAPNWIVPDQHRPDGNRRARYWADGEWRSWEDLVLVNYEHATPVTRAEVWQYMTEYALFWGQYANETGGFVRFDNLHSSTPDFVNAVATVLHYHFPDLAILAEYFTDDGTMLKTVPDWRLNLVLATPWNQKFVPELRAYLRDFHRLSRHIRYFMPATSHDSGTPAEEFGGGESTVPRYVAAALLGNGATGITQGVEWGAPHKLNFIGRQPRIAPPAEPRFATFLRSVNDILVAHAAFRSGGNCHFVDNDHPAVIAAFRPHPDASQGGFLVACNFDIHHSHQISCDLAQLLAGGTTLHGHELLSGQESRFAQAVVPLSLPACGAMVWQLTAVS